MCRRRTPELQAIAGLVSAADRAPYFTGLGTAALATFTAAGRTLAGAADAAAQRTALALGTMAQQDARERGDYGGDGDAGDPDDDRRHARGRCGLSALWHVARQCTRSRGWRRNQMVPRHSGCAGSGVTVSMGRP